jgi:hypothetical protein
LAVVNDSVTDTDGNALDGEWLNGADMYPSDNGSQAGDLEFRFNLIPGDVTHNGAVQPDDVGQTLGRQGTFIGGTTPVYDVFFDVNGTGTIQPDDVALVRARQGTFLPAGEPMAPMMGEFLPNADDAWEAFEVVAHRPSSRPAERFAARPAYLDDGQILNDLPLRLLDVQLAIKKVMEMQPIVVRVMEGSERNAIDAALELVWS